MQLEVQGEFTDIHSVLIPHTGFPLSLFRSEPEATFCFSVLLSDGSCWVAYKCWFSLVRSVTSKGFNHAFPNKVVYPGQWWNVSTFTEWSFLHLTVVFIYLFFQWALNLLRQPQKEALLTGSRDSASLAGTQTRLLRRVPCVQLPWKTWLFCAQSGVYTRSVHLLSRQASSSVCFVKESIEQIPHNICLSVSLSCIWLESLLCVFLSHRTHQMTGE